MVRTPTWDASLEPVRRAVVAAARRDAERATAGAAQEAERTRHRAVEAARRISDQARVGGRSDGDREVAGTRHRARTEARQRRLTAQRDAYLGLRARVLTRLSALQDGASYPGLREGLTARARAVLGPSAVVVDAPGGGIVATTEDRSLDLSFPALLDAVLDAMGSELEGLWTP